jgi:hypothetical protein
LEKENSHGGRGDRFEPANRSRSWLRTRVDIWPFAGNGVARVRVRIQGRVQIRLQKGIVVLIQDRREGTSRCRSGKKEVWFEERMLGVEPRIVKPSARAEPRNRSSKQSRNRGTPANRRKW